MPNLPETGEAPVTQVSVVQGPLKRGTVENVLSAIPEESTLQSVFLGTEALKALTNKGEGNTAVGVEALKANTTGTFNLAVGNNAMVANKEGAENTAVGSHALQANTSGTINVAVGALALGASTTAKQNTAVGTEALAKTKTGSENTAVGFSALESVETGTGNVAIGWKAGKTETGSNKLHIANNETTDIIKGVMSATAASNELELGTTGGKVAFFGTAAAAKPEVTGGTVTAKQLAEALATLGLVKVN